MLQYDVLVAGGGPAGIAAALLCKRNETTRTLDPALIRRHLIERGVQL